jgi:hypothetical protein
LISNWKREGDRNISLNGYSERFYSKKSGLKREGRGLFEYVVSLSDSRGKELKKLYLNFKPRIEGMSYWDKREGREKEWKINEKQGEGVEVYIQSSYHEPREIEGLILDVFRYFDIDRFYESWKKDETYLITFEDHIRYDEKKERDVVGIIEEIRTLIGLTNEGKWRDVGDRTKEGYRFRETVTDRWDKLGFENKGYYFLIKSYRLKKFSEVKDPILKNPKLEIGLDPKLNRGMRIRWNEADWLISLENSILENVAIWSGLTADDLVEDEMFKIRPNHVEVKEWEPKELKRYYMARAKEVYPEVFDNRTKRRFIYLLCDRSVLDTKELMEGLGLSKK